MTANLEDSNILKALSCGFGESKKSNGAVRVNRGNAAAKEIIDGYASIWSACEKGVEPAISEPSVDYALLSEDELVQVLRLKEYFARRAAFKCLAPVIERTEETVKRGLFRKTVETVTVSAPIPVGVDKLCYAFSVLFDGECGGAKELFAGALAELTVAAEPTDETAVEKCIDFLAGAFGGIYFNRLKKSSSPVINGNTVAETKIAEANWS